MSVKMDCGEEDSRLIIEIVRKAAIACAKSGVKLDRTSSEMDLTAWHLNAAPLDLERMADGDDFNIVHDVLGIQRHISRRTGKRKRGAAHLFAPRYTKRIEI